METKAEWRRYLKSARQALTTETVEWASQAVFEQLQTTVDWPAIRWLHCYLPVNNELDTWRLLLYCWQQWPQLRVAIPDPAQQHQATLVTAKTQWQPASQPPSPLVFQPPPPDTAYDLIIVPMLGYDTAGHRLGYGGGFYDRFLAAQPQAQKLGLAYTSAEVKPTINWESHDVAVDLVLTEKGVVKAPK